MNCVGKNRLISSPLVVFRGSRKCKILNDLADEERKTIHPLTIVYEI